MRNIVLLFLLTGLTAWSVSAVSPAGLSRALAAQEEVVADNPEDAGAYNDYGNLLLLAGRAESARSAYERSVELNPDLLSARYNLALLMQQEGELRVAGEQLSAIIDRAPDHAWAHYQLGRIAESQGRKRVAVRHYATAFRLNARLSFPDVNPSVIDSDLVTEALLEVPEGVRVPAGTPRIYEDSARITNLLLGLYEQQSEREMTGDRPERSGSPGAGSGPSEQPAVDGEQPGKGRAKVLGPDDLEEGSKVGEVSGPSAPSYRPLEGYLREQQIRNHSVRPQRSANRPGVRSTGQSRLRVQQDR